MGDCRKRHIASHEARIYRERQRATSGLKQRALTQEEAGVLRDYELDMQRRGLTRRSVIQLVGQVRAFDRWQAEHGSTVTDATPDEIQDFLDARNITAKTRAGWISSLHGFYKFGIRTGRLAFDPTTKIIRPKFPRTLPRPLTDSDLALALKDASPTMRAWVTLAAFAGLRCMEIAGLKVEDVIFDAGMIRVQGKGNVTRMVPLHPEVVRALRDAGFPRKGHVFRRPMGGVYLPKHISQDGSQYFRELGIPGGLHGARHWFATRTLDACGNLRTVQVLLGHADPSTTALYTQFSQRDGQAAVAALAL